MYVYMYGCKDGWMDGWMDGWIPTVNSLPIRGPNPGTPPADQGEHHAAHTYPPDTIRTHYTQGPVDCKQPGMYKPSLLKQPAGWTQTGCRKPPPSPKEAAYEGKHLNMWCIHTPSSAGK